LTAVTAEAAIAEAAVEVAIAARMEATEAASAVTADAHVTIIIPTADAMEQEQ
jgi:hypothetical protein